MSETDLKAALETNSVLYDKLLPKWKKTRILYKGEDEVHDAGTILLPKLEQQTPDMYQAYVERTRFLNALKRTVKGLVGTVKRKLPETELQSIEEYLSDIDSSGTTLKEYSDKILNEGVKIGYCATLVDYTSIFSNEEQTIAEHEASGARVKFCFYNSDAITKVQYSVINGEKKISLVKLKEKYEVVENEFEVKYYDQYRVLRLNNDGYYEQQLYKITESGSVDISEAMIVEKNGERLTTIPFFIHGEVEEPPLYDLVTTNVKHYQSKADHNHALHFIGLPQPYRTGVDPNDTNLPSTIGSSVVWDIENENAKVGFLELEGRGLDHLTGELDTIKDDMAFLGAAMLSTQELVNETATKATYRNASETSSLVDIVENLSDSLTKALKFFDEWANDLTESDVFYYYNSDFDITKLSADEIIKIVQGWQMGGYSKRSMYRKLEQGEFDYATDSFEDEEELINKGE